jgi:hypothetical protein
VYATNRSVIGPFGEDFVDGGIVDFSLAVAIYGYGQTLPLHASIQHPQDEVKNPVVAEFALGTAFWHGKVGQDKLIELKFRELDWSRQGKLETLGLRGIS